MKLKQQLKRMEQRAKKLGGGRHVIVNFGDKTQEEALAEYKQKNYVNPSDEIIFCNLNLGFNPKEKVNRAD